MNDIVWHCEQKDDKHLHGFDICDDCIDTFDPKTFTTKETENNQVELYEYVLIHDERK